MINLRRPSVLVAMSDASDRATLSAQSVEMGFATVSVGTDKTAWQSLQNAPAGIVVVDVMSRNVDGLDLADRIHEIASDQCVIVGVSIGGGVQDQRALASGIDDVLPRPINADAIRTRLLVAERLLASRKAHRAVELEAARLRWLASVGQLALTFQHEINNPLTALYGHLDLLRLCGQLDTQATSDVESAIAQAHRIEDIVRYLGAPGSATADRKPMLENSFAPQPFAAEIRRSVQ